MRHILFSYTCCEGIGDNLTLEGYAQKSFFFFFVKISYLIFVFLYILKQSKASASSGSSGQVRCHASLLCNAEDL